jgi:hypothetical protein
MEDYLKTQLENKTIDSTNKDTKIDPAHETKNKIEEIKIFTKKNKQHTNFKELAENEFKDFHTKYPTLFNKLLEEDCDSKQLDFMLKQLENIQKGTKTQHEASVEIGQILVDKFVKPELNKKK